MSKSELKRLAIQQATTTGAEVSGEPPLEDLAIEAATFLEKAAGDLPPESFRQAEYIAFALRSRVASSRVESLSSPAAERAAREIVGTVFWKTAASHDTLERVMLERIAEWIDQHMGAGDTEVKNPGNEEKNV